MNSWVRILVLVSCSCRLCCSTQVQCQRETLLWHAHILWLRSTVHGAIVILPKAGVPYQFPKLDDEVVVVLGEWWKSDIEDIINEALKSGLAPNVSDAHTINEGFTLLIENGKTYILRLINTTLNKKLFFKIVGHKLIVVEVDSTYVKPFKIDTIVIAPVQTTNVLVSAGQKSGKYLFGTLANTATTPTTPPLQNVTLIANSFTNSLCALNSKKYLALVPQTINHNLFFTVGLGISPCHTCKAESHVVAAINNVTFVMPTTDLLQAHYFKISGVFTADFPDNPPHVLTTPKLNQAIRGSTPSKFISIDHFRHEICYIVFGMDLLHMYRPFFRLFTNEMVLNSHTLDCVQAPSITSSTKIASLLACVAATYSAFVVDVATTDCNFETQLTALPTTLNTYHVVPLMYLGILFTVLQFSLPGFSMYRLTTPTACAMSGLVHIITNIKLPTADVYVTRDIYILSSSLLGLILEDNLKLIGRGVEISLQSYMFNRDKIFFK
ncbi:Laccase-22 [Hibiscus syriacus]|uniref:Laccase-22 n=1 Tax=Hibiscus syriacus TaxID=106335 RepID=A0A6A3BMY2_HIBSY|nr:Laccase-22 [Hibiscus syriacus]